MDGPPDELWAPAPERAAATHLAAFAGGAPTTRTAYDDLWRWSISDPTVFWRRVWEYCDVRAQRRYDEILTDPAMPGGTWFSGARLNYTQNLLRRGDDTVAVVAAGEGRLDEDVTWRDLTSRVARAQRGLVALGVSRGDRVAALAPNTVETLVLALATTSLGAIWSSCSPDFGVRGIVDRFGQIAPRVLVTADANRYHGQVHALEAKAAATLAELPSVEHVVVQRLEGVPCQLPRTVDYDQLLAQPADVPAFPDLPVDSPLYVLYSSGTTGAPKSIVHGAGGTLVQHLKEHQLMADVHAGDVLLWFTTCGWMMWNWLISALASEATIVLYDGSPTYPDAGVLWRLAHRLGVTHFGTSPRFLSTCAKNGLRPSAVADLSGLRAVLSTGSPLRPDQFDWVYREVSDDLQLASISGGTDLIGCFVGGVPTLPVRRGRIQGRLLGMAVEAWDAQGRAVVGRPGELVCTRPFPSMPLGFWDDADGARYRAAYFQQFAGVWTHGDMITVDADGSVQISGRSDTTLNPGGVRIGSAELYRAVEPLEEVVDAIAVARPVDGDVEVVLCVVLADGVELDAALRERINATIRSATSARHVPRHLFAVSAVPYTISGKKVETAVRAAMLGQPVTNRDALANPDALDEYTRLFHSPSAAQRT